MGSPELEAPSQQPAEHPERQWVRALKGEVHPTTWKKGREYAESRRVQPPVREGGTIKAIVTGSQGERYEVQIEPRSPSDIQSRCSCPAYGHYGPHCKHVVATALVYLARVAPRPKPTPPPEADGPQAAPRLDPAEAVSLPALAKLENWLGLSALPDHDYVYRITPTPHAHGGRHWVVDIRRADQTGKGPVNVKRLLTAGTRLSPADERIFGLLAHHESRYDARIVLTDEDLAEILGALKDRKVIYRGTSLNVSPQPARPRIRLESKDGSTQAGIELELPDGTGFSLKDAVLLAGKRTYAIIGQSLYEVQPELPARLLRKWLLEPSMSFPDSQLDRVLGFFAAHLPRFRMGLSAEGIQVEEGVEPTFVLTLEGGAERVKAKLAAKYGHATVPVLADARHLGFASGPGADGQGRKLYRRRDELERKAAQLLQEQGLKFEPGPGAYEASGDPAILFWSTGLPALPKTWEVFAAEAPKVRVRKKLRPKVKVSMSGVNWFELDASFATDDQQVDLGAVRMWLDSGRKFIPLKDGSYAEADRDSLKRAADLLEEAGALPGKGRTRLPLFQAAAIGLLTDLEDGFEIEAKARAAIRELQGHNGIPQISPPKDLNATLRHYQEAGLSWLWFLHRHGLSGVLADDMGLGKTLQALCLLQRVHDEEGPKPSLVVAPTSVLANWEREAQRFTPKLRTMIWHGQDRRERADQLQKVDLVLTSYSLVRRDVAELSSVGFRYLILDEAQNIKNADSATAQACKAIPSEQRLALTGTPLENRLSELWSLFDFLMPGFLGSASTFHERYEVPIQVVGDVSVRDRLRRRIHPFILRRMKQDVAKDLPPKTEAVAWVEMEPAQAALYREVLEESRRKVYDTIDKVGFKKSRVSILAALMRMRQVCCDPRLLKLPPGTLLPSSAKLERFGQLLEEVIAEDHRVLVFSQFTEMLELLRQEAEQRKIAHLYLDGRTRDRMARVDAFNAPEGPPVFFISLKAGGTGLNLTAADYVIHFDPWWNPAVEDQATDRTHRIGQTRSVISYKLITKGTVEEKILALQQRKRELAAGVLTTDDAIAKTLTEADVADLFQIDESAFA